MRGLRLLWLGGSLENYPENIPGFLQKLLGRPGAAQVPFPDPSFIHVSRVETLCLGLRASGIWALEAEAEMEPY